MFITNAYRADTRLTLLQSPRAWREAERIMALSRYTYLYVTLLPALFLRPLLTSSAADCTRKWRERLDYNYTPLFLKLVSCTRARYFPSKELFSIFTRGYFTQQVIRERNCFSKCLPQCPRPRGAQRPLEILAAIFYRDLSCLNGKFFSRRVIQMAWRSLEVVGISCKALVNYCAAEYFTGNARNWRTRIFFLEKGEGDANVPIWIIVYQASKLLRQFFSIQRLVIFTCFNNSQVIGRWKFHWWDFFFSTTSNNSLDLCAPRFIIVIRFI